MQRLLEAGVHFGHHTSRWNPKMKKYIWGARNGIHIIDLGHTVKLFQRAYDFVVQTAAAGKSVLFVGTKHQARDVIAEEATKAGMFHVTNRWLGGTLTNFKTVKTSLDRLKHIEQMAADGTLDRLTKKEAMMLVREREKLEISFGGIKALTQLPGAIFIIDTAKEHIAVKEAHKLEIPVVAVTDTNSDPDYIDYPIPGNDDAIRAIKLFCGKISEACALGRKVAQERSAGRMREQASEPETIHVASGGEGPRVEVVSRRRVEHPVAEASGRPDRPDRGPTGGGGGEPR
jgi:small subunit ribosomal protein S2